MEPETFHTNKDLMMYFIHGKNLYRWEEGMENRVDFIMKTQSTEFILIRKDEFVVRSDE